MARFYGVIGYAIDKPISAGNMIEGIIERSYSGEIIKHHTNLVLEGKAHPDINIANSISVVSDPYAEENMDTMRYVTWKGTRWRITSVDIQRPRIILTLGGRFNGPEAEKPNPEKA